MSGPYDDIVALPHPTSPKHPRMSRLDRAAQFSPFAALSGHDAAIRETARLTDQRVELDEDRKTELDMMLRLITEHPQAQQNVNITYFQPDTKKVGGSYKTVTGHIKKIDDYDHTIILTSRERVFASVHIVLHGCRRTERGGRFAILRY